MCPHVWGGAQWIMIMLIGMRTVFPILFRLAGRHETNADDWVASRIADFLGHLAVIGLLIWGGFF